MKRFKVPSVITLIVFILTLLTIYVDRGSVSGLPDVLRDAFGVSSVEVGAIRSVFILGFTLASPLTTHIAQYWHSLTVMAIGCTIWILAVLACGFVNNYWIFLGLRGVTGVAEALVFPLLPAYILRIAPAKAASVWTGALYSTIYLGLAVGYVYASQVYGALGNWHWVFLILSIAMVPWLGFYLLSHRPQFDVPDSETVLSFQVQVSTLLRNSEYVFVSLGLGAFTFTFGGLAFWSPDMVKHMYDQTRETATLALGFIMIIGGVLGTLTGSVVFELFSRHDSRKLAKQEISERVYEVRKAQRGCKFVLIYTSVGFVLGLASLLVNSFGGFLLLFGASLFCMCNSIGVLPIVAMLVVEPGLRKQAIGLIALSSHLLGNLTSPLLIGAAITWLGYKSGFLLAFLWLIFGFLTFGIAYVKIVTTKQRRTRRRVDYEGGLKEIKEQALLPETD